MSLGVASEASATVWLGSVGSPRQAGVPAGRDFQRVQVTYDDVAGSWAVAVTFFAPPDASTDALLRASRALGPHCAYGELGAEGDTDLAAYTAPSHTGMSYGRPGADYSKVYSPDGRTMTMRLTSPALVGRPACPLLHVGLSNRDGGYDVAGPIDLVGPDGLPAPYPRLTPQPAPAPPRPTRLTAKLPTTLRLARDGTVRVALSDANVPVMATVRLSGAGIDLRRRRAFLPAGTRRVLTLKVSRSLATRLRDRRRVNLRLAVTLEGGIRGTRTLRRAVSLATR